MKQYKRAIVTTALLAAATLPISSIANAAPSVAGETISVTGNDGSGFSWEIPGQVANHERALRAAEPIFDTTTGENGKVSTIFTIPNASSPKRYNFDLNLPRGYVAELQEGGSVTVNNDSGIPIGSFATPWARDANGSDVPTSYSLEGNTLVQQVNFSENTAFPVTADPTWSWGIATGHVYFNKPETRQIALGGTVVSWMPNPGVMWAGRSLAVSAGLAVAMNQCLYFKVGLGWGGLPLLPGSPFPVGVGIHDVGQYGDGNCVNPNGAGS